MCPVSNERQREVGEADIAFPVCQKIEAVGGQFAEVVRGTEQPIGRRRIPVQTAGDGVTTDVRTRRTRRAGRGNIAEAGRDDVSGNAVPITLLILIL